MATETLTAAAASDAAGTETGYIYQRADGTIERADNREEAFALCPVLGQLAIEDPARAQMLLDLAAQGQEKIDSQPKDIQENTDTEDQLTAEEEPAAEEPAKAPSGGQAEQAVSPVQITEPEVKSTEQLTIKSEEAAAANIEEAANGRSETVQEQGPAEPAAKSETGSVSTAKTAAENHPEKTSKTAGIRQTQTDTENKIETVAPADEISRPTVEAIKNPAEPEITAAAGNQTEHFTQEQIIVDETTAAEEPEAELLLEDGYINEVSENTGLDTTFQIPESMSEPEPVISSAEINIFSDQELAELFEPETIETYKEILALSESGETVLFTLAAAEHIQEEQQPLNDFERFIAEQPRPEEPATLEFVQEHANEQAVEQTFMQLSELLADAGQEERPSHERIGLYKILLDIETALPTCYSMEETEAPKFQITPEMTEKLLNLLRQLGYEEPQEALVLFIKQYGLAFLLQALQHMCRINHNIEKPEFTVSPVAAVTSSSLDAHLRLGKTLLGLLGGLDFEPAGSARAAVNLI
jgi:hypothetical protein